MSNLLKRYIRLAVLEAADARVPNQLISTGEEETEAEDNHVQEFAACGGGNTLASGNIVGYSAPLGMDPDKLGRKKNASKKKRKK
jgi:hypothetical protein